MLTNSCQEEQQMAVFRKDWSKKKAVTGGVIVWARGNQGLKQKCGNGSKQKWEAESTKSDLDTGKVTKISGLDNLKIVTYYLRRQRGDVVRITQCNFCAVAVQDTFLSLNHEETLSEPKLRTILQHKWPVIVRGIKVRVRNYCGRRLETGTTECNTWFWTTPASLGLWENLKGVCRIDSEGFGITEITSCHIA